MRATARNMALCVMTIQPLSLTWASDSLLDPAGYLAFGLQHHVELLQHRSNENYHHLVLRDARQRYVPKLTLGADWEESKTARVRNPEPIPDTPAQLRRSASANATSTWRLPTGTQLQLRAEQQTAQQKGQSASGIPEDFLEVQNYSLEVTQPLLREWSPSYNRLPLNIAESEYAQFEVQLRLAEWSVLEQGLNGLIELQRQQDRVTVHEDLAATLQDIYESTAVFYREGKATLLELETLELEWRRMQHQLNRERALLNERQKSLFVSMVESAQPEVITFSDLSELIHWMERSIAIEPSRPSRTQAEGYTHPELQLEQVNLRQARWQYEQERRSHWPDIEVFYRYDQSVREKLPDSETQSWGVRFEYTLNNLPVRTVQARRQSALSQAEWAREDKQRQLAAEYSRIVSEMTYMAEQEQYMGRLIELSERSLQQEWQRFEAGFSNARNIQRESKNLLEKSIEHGEISAQYARSLTKVLAFQFRSPREWLNAL